MPKTIRWLGALLAAQILMAVGLNLPALRSTAQSGTAPLVAIEKNLVNRIVIEGPDHTKVVLVKEEETWTLPELGKFPADTNRVNTLLDKVIRSKTGAPIATTAGAKARFKVSDEAFERRLALAQNDQTLATLYLGSSPGPRRSYARADGEDAVFALELAPYELPMELADWEDKTILQLPKNDITAIEVAGLRLEPSARAGSPSSGNQTDNPPQTAVSSPVWEVKGPEGDRRLELKPDAVDKLVRLLADLTFDKVVGRDANRDYGLEKPSLTITLTKKTGDTMTYLLGKNPKKEEYTLTVSNRPEYFRLPSYQATALLEAADRKQLLHTASEARSSTKG